LGSLRAAIQVPTKVRHALKPAGSLVNPRVRRARQHNG
jgi:hypothetical protein